MPGPIFAQHGLPTCILTILPGPIFTQHGLPTCILTALPGLVFAEHGLPTCILTTLQGLVFTQHDLPTGTPTTLQSTVLTHSLVLTHYEPAHAHTALLIDVLTEHAHTTPTLAILPVRVFTEQASSMQVRLTQLAAVRIEHVWATQSHLMRPIDAFPEHACTMPALAARPIPALAEHALPTHAARPILAPATPAPHMRIVLPDGVFAGAWPLTYPDDSERPGFFTGIAALDHEIGGIPKAALTQVCAPRRMSSGRAAILSSLLAQVTGAEEVCALIDAGASFNPGSAATAGVDLSRLLWVRCGKKMKEGCAEKSAAGSDATVRSRAMADSHVAVRSHMTADPYATAVPDTPIRLHAMARFRATINPHATTIRPHAPISSGSMTDRDGTINFRPTTGYQSTPVSRRSATGNNRIATSSFRGADALRMQPVEQAFKAADILIQNGGFGLIVIDLGEIEERLVRKIPLTTWFRFARVIERQPTALVVFATYPAAQGCAALTLHIKSASARWHSGAHTHTQIFSGLTCEVELGKARGRARKAAQSAKAGFAAKPVWK